MKQEEKLMDELLAVEDSMTDLTIRLYRAGLQLPAVVPRLKYDRVEIGYVIRYTFFPLSFVWSFAVATDNSR